MSVAAIARRLRPRARPGGDAAPALDVLRTRGQIEEARRLLVERGLSCLELELPAPGHGPAYGPRTPSPALRSTTVNATASRSMACTVRRR